MILKTAIVDDTDIVTINRIASLAEIDQRKPAEIIEMAINFLVGLPPEARAILWEINSKGNESDLNKIYHYLIRALLDAKYNKAHSQVIEEMKIEHLGPIETEDDILLVAVGLG